MKKFPRSTRILGNFTNEVNDKSPPVVNTWFTAHEIKKSGMLHSIEVFHDNTDNTNKVYEFKLTLDDITYTGSTTLVDATPTAIYIDGYLTYSSATALLNFASGSRNLMNVLYGSIPFRKLCKLEIRTTDAVGTAQHCKTGLLYSVYD